MALLPPFFLDCVVAIGFPDSQGKVNYVATGFFYGFLAQKGETEERNTYHTFLVTNRHVFENKPSAKIRLNPHQGAVAREFDLPLIDTTGQKVWTTHPDPEVDVALWPVAINWLRDQGIRCMFFAQEQHALTISQYAQRGGSEGDGVFVLGFPMGNIGGDLNYVIVRAGSIARMRDCVTNSVKTFLVDANIFPGNSGGPVVNRPDVAAIADTTPVSSSYLIGMISQYLTYSDVAVSQQTGKPRVIFEENSGLAIVVPVQFIEQVAAMVIATQAAATSATEPIVAADGATG